MTGCKRITYIDIAKILAMFLVVYTHTAQNIAQDNYMNEIGFTSIQSLHMPLFMIMSGYFLNLGKLKNNKIVDYLKKKFLHLVLPTFFWYTLLVLAFNEPHDLRTIANSYWFLKSLFISLAFIMVSVKITNSVGGGAILALLIVLVVPHMDMFRVNFTLPFVLIGVFFKKIESKFTLRACIALLLLYICLLFFWKYDYTVYVTPLRRGVLSNLEQWIAFGYRILIGSIGSFLVMSIVKRIDSSLNEKVKSFLCLLGSSTLEIYLLHYIFNRIFCLLIDCDQYSQFCLSLVCLILSCLNIMGCMLIKKYIGKSSLLSKLLLGKNI